MLVGTEWIIDAFECDAESLRDENALREIFARVVEELGLSVIKEVWHQFPAEFGLTGFAVLSESHLACHTYPEFQTATFNLYCCKSRPEWNWEKNLFELIGAKQVKVTKVERGSNASVPLAVSGASRVPEENKTLSSSNFPDFDFNRTNTRNRGYLPHWEQENAIYFVTFRLADSLPKNVAEQLFFEREQFEKNLENLSREIKPEEKNRAEFLSSEKLEDLLDSGYGECHLKNSQIAEIVQNSLYFFDNQKYRLFAWCVMPNHVHALLQVFPHQNLSEITHSWKSFTAHEANKILGLTGKFWQRESFDRIVRNEDEFYRIIKYIRENPIKSGLQNWRWVGVKDVSEKRFENSKSVSVK